MTVTCPGVDNNKLNNFGMYSFISMYIIMYVTFRQFFELHKSFIDKKKMN